MRGQPALAAAALLALLAPQTGAHRGAVGARMDARACRCTPASATRPRAHALCAAAARGVGPDEDDAEAERLELGRRRMEEIFRQGETVDTSTDAVSATERLLQQLFPSSQFVGGGKLPTKFLFVDELVCIGCTHCRFVAPKTFMLEDDFGRARVYRQGGDSAEKIDEAIECCPVECIHQVSHTELVRLEAFREAQGDQLQGKFWKSRLVGSELGIPKVPNWWEPLLDSSQPAWAGLVTGPTSMSALGFLGPTEPPTPVELDMWGNPIEPPPTSDEAEAGAAAAAEAEAEAAAAAAAEAAAAAARNAALDAISAADVEVCDLVDCGDARTADLAAQLERALLLEHTALCDVVSCDDALRGRDGAAPPVDNRVDNGTPADGAPDGAPDGASGADEEAPDADGARREAAD
ncbi:hypothetical protein KFE25_006418 [Diacronema lutheri]|uniref:4Fe-4S ferredoxin-type domain-containing protein n=1 Tax=Diacronema lutheri TaxID=2081491 RepID=A0A8J5XQS4_DIALT|nr:hypothetical protein KFE25_006418 [Diacronema lutheri]